MNGMSMQPVHGDVFGWVVVAAGALATIWTISLFIYWVFRPGETDPSHPKNMILKEDR